jgi:uroporphyrin-III C-methyltransferase
MKGKVYLVGAGPGDPELLTVKALRVLRAADAVLHDGLIAPEILELIPPTAQRYDVGKRCGKKTISQPEINFLMVALADSGLQVVRLKSGDPLIFGRLGEEIEALRKGGVECEVVPGVTAAFGAAAALEVPLTERRLTASLVLLSGHRAAGSEDADWRKHVANGATLVVYMPGQNYSEVANRLRQAGVAGTMPCAIASRATTREQQTEVTTVRELAHAQQLPAPSLLIVGDVVRFAKRVDVQPAPHDGDSEMLAARAANLAQFANPKARSLKPGARL